MAILVSPERQAFIDREVLRGAGTPEQIADRALKLYEEQVERLRVELGAADLQARNGQTIAFEREAFRKAQDAKFADRIANAADAKD